MNLPASHIHTGFLFAFLCMDAYVTAFKCSQMTLSPSSSQLHHFLIHLSSTERISNVTLMAKQTDFVEFNSPAIVACSVSSGSSLSFLWLNGSSEVTAGERVQLTDGNSTLTVINVTRYDRGPFRCRVSNPVSNGTSDPVNLNIICE